jgi:signal transduction histidine kinase
MLYLFQLYKKEGWFCKQSKESFLIHNGVIVLANTQLNTKEGFSHKQETPLFLVYKYSIFMICIMTVILFFVSIPVTFTTIKNTCIEEACPQVGAIAPTKTGLKEIGWNETSYAGYYTGLYSVFSLFFIGAAGLLTLKKSNDRLSLFTILALCTFGVSFTDITSVLTEQHWIFEGLNNLVYLLGSASIVLFFFIFPNGHFDPKWTKWMAGVLILTRTFEIIFPFFDWSINDSVWTIGLWLVLWLICQLYSQIYRYRNVSTEVEKKQTKWVVFGFGVVVVGFLSVGVIPVFAVEGYITEGGPLKFILMNLAIYGVFAIIPITITIAIMRHRLWNIDMVLRRTFVYGTLSLFIVSVYVVVVWYLGYVFQHKGNLLFSLIATTIVAVLFGPIKERTQKTANRFFFGERENPYRALESLSEKLAYPLNSKETLHMVAKTIKEAMRLPYVSVQAGDIFKVEEGMEQSECYYYPIFYKGEQVGVAALSPRYPGERFYRSDQKLLDLLISQAATVIHSIIRDQEVYRLNERLQESREQLVMAREEERRRLRRNLHDDLAPRLAALALNAGNAEDLIKVNPTKAIDMLADVRLVIRNTVSDIRQLVRDLRPGALDELGLIGAIQERINDLNPVGENRLVKFEFFKPKHLPVLPAAVEVAAFRIITEAVVNVIKHARAGKCIIIIEINEELQFLDLQVIDDGIGLNTSQSSKGIGLYSMKERALELGGEYVIECMETGTKVSARLPLAKTEESMI